VVNAKPPDEQTPIGSSVLGPDRLSVGPHHGLYVGRSLLRDSELRQDLTSDAVRLSEQAQQEMLRPDKVMAVLTGDALGMAKHSV
jgi:hypothetical protein